MTKDQEQSVAVRDPFEDLVWQTPWLRFGDIRRRMDEILRNDSSVGNIAPAVDITETAEAYVITAEIPGVKKDDISVEVQDGAISIRGEKRSKRDESTDTARRLERVYGAFSRTFSLPSDAQVDKVDASFENGVLTLTVARQPESKPQQVAIQ